MATYWENSCSFGLRYVSWYKYLIVNLVFSHLGFWSGNLFLIAPFPDLCLLVPFFQMFFIAVKNENFLVKKKNEIFLFCSKHRLLVHTEVDLTSTHNFLFNSKIKKNRYTPVNPNFTYKSGVSA